MFCRDDEMSTAWAKSTESVELSRVEQGEEQEQTTKPQNWIQQGLARINTKKRIKSYGTCSESMEDDSKLFSHQVSALSFVQKWLAYSNYVSQAATGWPEYLIYSLYVDTNILSHWVINFYKLKITFLYDLLAYRPNIFNLP